MIKIEQLTKQLGILLGAAMLVKKGLGNRFDAAAIIQFVDSIPLAVYLAAGVLVCIIALFASMRISTWIMEKKEY